MTALVGAMVVVLIDLILRFRDYRTLLHSLPVIGTMKSAGAIALVFLQVVALFYLIALLPRPLRVAALLPSVFVATLQFSYWLTLSQFMTGTDVFLALTVGGDNRLEAISSFLKPLVFLYALPYVLILSALILVPSGSGFQGTLPSASCRYSFSSLPIMPSSSTCLNAASI